MSVEWMAIRGSGLIAFVLLAGSTIWGLLISTKVLGRSVKAKPVAYFHESLAIGSLVATGIHMFFLYNHDYIEYTYRELFLPGASTFEPLAVALGVVAFYSMLIISVSFYVKKWIGQNAWRAIHMASFGTFVGAALHGIFSGTDTGHPIVAGTYVASSSIVLMLLVVRLAQAAAPPQRSRSARSPGQRAGRTPAERNTGAVQNKDKPAEVPAGG